MAADSGMPEMYEVSATLNVSAQQIAVLDDTHIGDINGAFGTIRRDDHGPRHSWRSRIRTLLAILGPGLIVMVGDNDAGAFGPRQACMIRKRNHRLSPRLRTQTA
jgi:hypothetical protein